LTYLAMVKLRVYDFLCYSSLSKVSSDVHKLKFCPPNFNLGERNLNFFNEQQNFSFGFKIVFESQECSERATGNLHLVKFMSDDLALLPHNALTWLVIAVTSVLWKRFAAGCFYKTGFRYIQGRANQPIRQLPSYKTRKPNLT